MRKLSPTQQRLLDELIEKFGDEPFSVSFREGLFITNRRGTSVEWKPRYRRDTWHAIWRAGLVESVSWDHIGHWYKVVR